MRAVACLAAIAMLGVAAFYPAALRAKEPGAYLAADDVGTVVLIYPDACVADVDREVVKFAAMVEANTSHTGPKKEDYRRASVRFEGKDYGACWVAIGSRVVMVDDGKRDNSIFTVPVADFQPLETI